MINDSINRFLGVLCYPFTSLNAFREDLIREYREALNHDNPLRVGKAAKKIKGRLQEEVVSYIRSHYNMYSYDEIYLYLDKCYLYHAGEWADVLDMYLDIMQKMAKTLISHRDGRIVFKYWRNEEDEALFGGFAGSNKVALFHSLNCHIPMDVIAITYMVMNQRQRNAGCLDRFYGNIIVADQQLSGVLEQGVSENHLHKGVSRSFPSIWNTLMQPVFSIGDGKKILKEKIVSGIEPEKMCYYVLGCGIVRMWMTWKLAGVELPEKREEESGGRLRMHTPADDTLEQIREVHLLVNRFCRGKEFEDYYDNSFSKDKNRDKDKMLAYFAGMWSALSFLFPEDYFKDGVCARILGGAVQPRTLDETIFLYRAMYAAIYDRELERRVKQCLFQYLRVRTYVFHESVQQKTVKGLDYFQSQHYQMNSTLNKINVDNYWKTAIREQLQNPDLKKIEFRTSLPDNYGGLKKLVKEFLSAYKDIIEKDYCDANKQPCRQLPRVGLVFHFLKRPDETSPEKCRWYGTEDCGYLSFGKLRKQYEKQMDNLIQLRSEYGELSRYLVGIDAASLENSTPVWVFAPIYEKARDSSVDPLGRNPHDGQFMQSLGFTFHAGEDFRHILSGLRRIDEAVEFLKFHAGDRIGHGIALGISPESWRRSNPVIVIPQVEALENYLWAYAMLGKNYSEFQASILAYMENRIFELARAIYGDMTGITTEALVDGYRMLFRPGITAEEEQELKTEMCRNVQNGKNVCWNSRLLAASRHCAKFVRKMEQPIHYEITEQDILITKQLQKMMQKKLGEQGIVVEINPSSNTAIADMDVVEENQFYQLNSLMGEQNLITCINSDDPTVFHTNVSNELAYIYYGMLGQNVSREAALQWIDRVRKNGMDSSFIRSRESDQAMLDNLNTLIENL